jgi:hypothetical protein
MSNEINTHVQSIADTLTHGFSDDDLNYDGEPMGAFDYLQDALDIEYIVNDKGEYLGARVLVAFGGPNIWVDTKRGIVEGAWWGDSATASFTDNIGLNDALEELWNCR